MNNCKPEPKYRRPLNNDQLDVLYTLYHYRFATSTQLAAYHERTSNKHIQKRLKILEDQGYIAKRYDKTYKLQGKPAEYYLTPKGAKILQPLFDKGYISDQAIKNRYKDKTASRKFIDHNLDILSVYLQLKTMYPKKLEIFLTPIMLKREDYDYFPKWKPDIYFTIKGGEKGQGKTHQYFLDIFDEHIPFFIRVRRIKSYIIYADSGEWEGEFPTILMVCENSSTQKRLRRRITKELNEVYDDDTRFYTTTMGEFIAGVSDRAVWQYVTDTETFSNLC
jgi:DNA-binding HxlR family transcriptional regulator